ncbi:carbonate dehydratase [Ophiostoma piceae UAMH 11346]|uniref:Carbonic anhydrase n=1 Tax=Ophiostoma piceae (strain UAMH 11346) TaxID=1262450 RepID=S3CV93_OPHP1|nr:carbonate dehydratase [Ophiostoma piceae UAMH 11346]
MTTEIQKSLVERNAAYAGKFTKGGLPLPPGKKYLILTCMDARIDAAAAFGVDLGDAHIIRNAGASSRDALRSILISEQLLGTREIVLIKHSGCGMLTFTNEAAHSLVQENLGPEAAAEIATLDFLPFPDLDQAVRDDVDFLQKQKTIPESVAISGWVYQVENGLVRRVV